MILRRATWKTGSHFWTCAHRKIDQTHLLLLMWKNRPYSRFRYEKFKPVVDYFLLTLRCYRFGMKYFVLTTKDWLTFNTLFLSFLLMRMRCLSRLEWCAALHTGCSTWQRWTMFIGKLKNLHYRHKSQSERFSPVMFRWSLEIDLYYE